MESVCHGCRGFRLEELRCQERTHKKSLGSKVVLYFLLTHGCVIFEGICLCWWFSKENTSNTAHPVKNCRPINLGAAT